MNRQIEPKAVMSAIISSFKNVIKTNETNIIYGGKFVIPSKHSIL